MADQTHAITMPPSDADVARPDRSQDRREAVEAMVRRCLDPAMGLCLRAVDPTQGDSEAREAARKLVMGAIADIARRHVADDDATVRRSIARVAELALDALVGNPGHNTVPSGVDLDDLLPAGTSAESVAPGGQLSFAVLLDAVAAARVADRRVAFIVLAAGVDPGDAGILLGTSGEAVEKSLHRIARRIAEGHTADHAAEVA